MVAVAAYWARPAVLHRILRISRRRLVYGLPLGTFVIVGVNVVFFGFAQRAFTGDHLLTIPYFSWSYGYPSGFLTGPIGHNSTSHILGNLLTTLVFAPVAEYVIGHKSSRRPLVRALVVIPLFFYAIGVFVSVFSLGPSIGFSGVVFFFFGFVVVFYPLVSVGLIVVSGGVRTVVAALRSPVSAQSTVETVTTSPSWANIAVDAHALGFLLGIGLAVLLARRRGTPVDGYKVGLAVLLVGLAQGLHLVWLAEGDVYVLYRGLGVSAVAALAVILGFGTSVESSATPFLELDDLPLRRSASLAALVLPILAICVIGFVAGLGTVSPVDDVEKVEVGDYSVWYGEDVENERVVSIPLIEFTPANFTASGVIVTSEDRGTWHRQASARALRSNPDRRFVVGGLTWDEEVHVERVGLSSPTGGAAYSVFITAEDEEHAVFDSSSVGTRTTVDGWSIGLSVTEGRRAVTMERDGERRKVYLARQPTEVEGITFEVDDRRVVASHNETTVIVGNVDGTRRDALR